MDPDRRSLEHLPLPLSLPSFVRTHFVLDPEIKNQRNDELDGKFEKSSNFEDKSLIFILKNQFLIN